MSLGQRTLIMSTWSVNALGGYSDALLPRCNSDCCDVNADRWYIAPMPQARSADASVAIGSSIWVQLGGRSERAVGMLHYDTLTNVCELCRPQV